ncbi:MAG: right-handed parallel beta-helix repeat-containing protein [Ginsengibacter sp.]
MLLKLIITILSFTVALLHKIISPGSITYCNQPVVSLLTAYVSLQRQDEIFVRDFGAVPGDGKDDSQTILSAIEYAKIHKVRKVSFDRGIYEFKTLSGWEEKGRKPSCYISLHDISNLELSGAVDTQGKPATQWVKHNDLKECQPMILSIEQGTNITVQNIAVDMAPYYYSAGKVVTVQGDKITIKVLDGHPRTDGQKAYIMGVYDLEAHKAKVVRITWDTNLPQWHMTGREKDRQMTMHYTPLAQSCKAGDGVFWFQGNYDGALLHFGNINTLLLKNVTILNGHGFPVTCEFCHDVVYTNVSIKPEGNRIATTCRDGLKIFCGSGKLLMDGVHIEGCLGDDGQNIHGIWLSVLRKQPGNSLFTTTSMPCLTPGKAVVLLDNQFHPAWRSKVESCTIVGKEMQIIFSNPIPDWVQEKTPIEPQEWLPDSVHIVNSVYRSTGRFGILLKSSNTLIENCLFENNVAAIHIGGEWSWDYWLESTNSQHVEIRNCTFRDNHLDMRFGGKKMDVAINVASWTNPGKLGEPSEILSGLVLDLRIHDNLFENESVCVNLQNCGNVWFWNNTLKNCGKDLMINEKTAQNVFRSAH